MYQPVYHIVLIKRLILAFGSITHFQFSIGTFIFTDDQSEGRRYYDIFRLLYVAS